MKNSFVLLALSLMLSCTLTKKDDNVPARETTSVDMPQQSGELGFSAIEGNNPNGSIVKFADIKAKYILVEFWASWCPPCRQFNPHLVKIYNRFQPKGFEVLSISLDNNPEKWVKAIEKDGLRWPYHISDLKGWESQWAVQYGIEEIPNSFLVDSTGKVVARSLSHEQLASTLATLLEK